MKRTALRRRTSLRSGRTRLKRTPLRTKGGSRFPKRRCPAMCRTHHRRQHAIGIRSFELLYADGCSLAQTAEHLGQIYRRLVG